MDTPAAPLDLDAIAQRALHRHAASVRTKARYDECSDDCDALLAEVRALRAEQARLLRTYERELNTAAKDQERLEREVAAARAALAHYADTGNWDNDLLDTPDGTVRVYEPYDRRDSHGWDVARAALGQEAPPP